MTDIASCKFSATVDMQYVTAIQTGLKLTSKYTYSDTCISNTVAILDGVYGFNTNLTAVQASTTDIW